MDRLKSGDARDELVATVALLQAQVLSPTKISSLLDYVGSAVDLMPAEVGGASIEGLPQPLRALDTASVLRAKASVEAWTAAGYDVRSVVHANFPVNLRAVFDKPPVLFLSGQWDDAHDACAVSVVGTRTASLDGLKRAFRIAKALASKGMTIVSGLAKGVDAAAHRGALKAGGRTVAVMGTGINGRYPKENAGLASEILESGGALLSQFFPDQPPTHWTFPVRNVTMSGLSLATIVIEAGITSGAKKQAEAALIHGREVFLPTSLVESHPWARAMIEDGIKGARAIQVGSADEVVDLLTPNSPAALVA